MMRILSWLMGSALGVLALSACGQQPAQTTTHPGALQQLLGAQADVRGFARAVKPRELHFPADHGPHLRYRTEWWYFTGTLQDARGRHFGFELTFFRFALTPQLPAGSSPWRTNQVYMVDFAVTNPAGQHFHAYQRFSRGALGLAGAQASPFRVWVDDWSVGSASHGFPWQLKARRGRCAIALELMPIQGVVLNGQQGLSRKGPLAGDASYYYSMPRLGAHGILTLQGGTFRVSGNVWMDHEWSTSALAANQVGWDWFGLRLDDGADLMLYQLRDHDGRKDPFSAGTWVSPAGRVTHLPADAFTAVPTAFWQGPEGGRYPVGWKVTVPSQGLEINVHTRLDNQLLPFAVRYWEGMVTVTGQRQGRPVHGDGYLELTGYGRKDRTGP